MVIVIPWPLAVTVPDPLWLELLGAVRSLQALSVELFTWPKSMKRSTE